jgi:TolB-like protein
MVRETQTTKQAIRLAVLPFDNLTGDVEQDYFSRGFVEDLIIDLSRFSNLEIISSHTSLSLDSSGPDEKQSAKKMGADFILKGTLRKLGDKLRISTQLVDPFHEHTLWGERYDAPLETVFDIQDNIIEKVVSTLSIQIESSILSAARKKPDTQLQSYDYWLKGYEFLRQGTLQGDAKARALFNNSLKIDPHYGRAYAGLSLSYFNEWSCQLWKRWDENEAMAYKYALEASKYDQTDHLIQMVLGRVLLYRREFDQAAKHLERAFELNQNDADNLVQLAGSMALLGDADKGIQLFEKALKLNPNNDDWYNVFGTLAYFVKGDYDRLIEITRNVSPTISVDMPAYMAAAYAYLGDQEKAKYYAQIYLRTFKEKITYGREPESGEPLNWILHVNPFRNESDVDHLKKGLQLAGLEEIDISDIDELQSEKTIAEPQINVFRKTDSLWEFRFANKTVKLPEVKGFSDLIYLISRQNEKVHCSELMGGPVIFQDGEEILDTQAKDDYKKRLLELQEELEEAEEMNDLGRSERLHLEFDQLTDQLAKAMGIGGRTRKIGSSTEKARTAVTWRIRSAIQKIDTLHPQLAKHLSNTIQTGTFCMYSPENEQLWQL